MQIEDFSLGVSIGKGAFGEVYLTTRNGTNKLYATKKIPKNKVEAPTIKKHFIDEINILKTLDHKNIIKLETIRQTANNYYIISEYYNGGGLYEALQQYKLSNGTPFPENVVQHFMRQIIDALIYLHGKKIIHRDLKLENLLLNYESEEDRNNSNLLKAEIKIIDFGFSTYLDGTHLRYSILGSPINMDPILLTKLNNQNISYLIGYDEKADIWSLGTVCYEMATGEMLFQAVDINQLIRKVEIGAYHIPTNLSQELVSFLQGMLQYLAKYRLSALELSSHPFLTKNVNNFNKIDLSDPKNKFDAFGLIVNIKKFDEKGIDTYELIQRLNIYPFSQRNYYNQQGYNYFENNGPKYYNANLNRNNYGFQQYNQRQIVMPYQNYQNFQNQQNYNNQNVIKTKFQNKYKYKSDKQLNNFNYNYMENMNIKKENNYNNNEKATKNGIIPKKYESNKNISSYNINTYSNNQNEVPITTTNIPNPDILNYSPPITNDQFNNFISKEGHNGFYNQFTAKNRMNNSFINKPNKLYEQKYFSTNIDKKKEVSSDALDNLFDLNIGKELDPEPDINVED